MAEVNASRFSAGEWDAVRKLQKGKQPAKANTSGVDRLTIRGFIEKDAEGVYRLTEAGLDALANSTTI